MKRSGMGNECNNKRIEIMKEVKVYLVDVYNYEFDSSPLDWNNEKFISEAEIQGNVYSLLGFQDYYNMNDFDAYNSFIRVI